LADAEQKFTTDYNNASGAWKEHVNMEDFTYFTYSAMLNIPAPVQLSAFNGTIRGKDVLLDWRMENINKVAGFEVEFSFDGKQFDDIAFVPSNTSSKEYSYTTSPIAQSAYYRLKSIGKDGKSHYSDAIHVQDKSESVSVVSIFPNPASGSINIRTNITNDEGYQVFNNFGQVVLQGTKLPESLSVDALTSGLYVLNAGGVSTRFMKE
jgi:hypothetical protein